MGYRKRIVHKKTKIVYVYAGYEELYDYHNNTSWGVYYPIIKGKPSIEDALIITDHYNYVDCNKVTKVLYE